MSKNLLQKVFIRNKKLVELVKTFEVSTKAKFWVEDTNGTIVFGIPFTNPAFNSEITVFNELLGMVRGDELSNVVGSWITQYVTMLGEQKELGAELLNAYREINFMCDFSDKLSSVTGISPVAELALKEAKRIFNCDQGVVFKQTDLKDFSQVIARIGTDFDVNEVLAHLHVGSSYEIMNLSVPDSERWALFASLEVNKKVLGSMMLIRNERSEFSAGDLKLLTTLALQTASAMEIALQYEVTTQKTLELSREKLEKDKLQQLEEMKSRFYANITHEFRTPLTVILGIAGMPENHNSNDIKERFNMIRRNGADMLRLVDQLLELNEMESQPLQLRNIQADIISYIKQLIEPLQTYAKGKDILIYTHTFNEHFWMEFDPDKLQKILSNLISNAIKFTTSGGQIVLAIEKLADPANEIIITVSDTGVGIPEEDLPKVFDRFFKSEKQRTTGYRGSGIGLSHSRELARLMGGDIKVKSKEGTGTSFSITLPFKDLKLPGDKIETGLLPFQSSFRDEKPLLLLIEDNSDLVTFLTACLIPHYQIEVAMDGQQGISKAFGLIPDIIISDVMLPFVDGFEICEHLKVDERTSHIPIILLTAKTDVSSKLAGLRQGADAYLGKPFELEELLLRLEKLLEQRTKLQIHYSNKALSKIKLADDVITEIEDAFIEKVKNILNSNLADEDFGLVELCRKIGMSRSQLFRKMKALINESPSNFIRMYRLHKAKELLENTDMQVSEVAYEVGFKDPAYFSYSFHETFGFTPSSVRTQ